MNAGNHEDMVRIEEMTLDEWKADVTPHQSWLWCNDLISLIKATHYEIDKADVMFCDGNLRRRVELLRQRMEEAESETDS